MARAPRRSAAGLARRRRLGARPQADRRLPASGLRRRGPQPDHGPWPRRRRPRLPAPSRRLRRELRHVLRHQHPGEAARHPPDGRDPDLFTGRARREGRAHRRPVRQAPLLPYREDRRPRAADVPRPHRQRPDPDAGRSHPGPRAPRAGLPPVGVDAEPATGLQQGRFRRPLPRARVDAGVRRHEP